jgi:hypothetical protein
MARASTWLFALTFAGAFVACMTDHSALEKMPTENNGAGSGGVSSTGGSPALAGTGSGDAAVGGHPDDEAPGTSVLTVVHGVVDAPGLELCFAKVASDGTVTPFGQPLSDAPLAYGHNLVLHAVSGADLASDVLQPFLIAGQLDLVSGLDCAAALALARSTEAAANPTPESGAAGAADGGAGGTTGDLGAAAAGGEAGAPPEVQSPLRARGLPAIPAGTLNGGRSYLLVATGCMGGAAFDAPSSEDYCGAGYSEHTPTVSAILVALSRLTSVNLVGMQVVHASLATGTVSLTSDGGVQSGAMPISIVTNLLEGELLPRPASVLYTASEYGSALGYSLVVSSQNTTLLIEPWLNALASGGVAALANGSTYALVLLGPRADLKSATAFWNAPAITVVPADPN